MKLQQICVIILIVLLDLKGYTRTLVTEEMNLGNLIESAARTMAQEEAKEEDEDTTDMDDLDLKAVEEEVLTDGDFLAHYEFVEQQQAEDEATMRELLGEDDE